MSLLVWAMMGIAIWHFTIFLPDRFRGGIVGAFLAALFGAVLVGLIINGFSIPGRHDTTHRRRVRGGPGRPHRAGQLSYFWGDRTEPHRPRALDAAPAAHAAAIDSRSVLVPRRQSAQMLAEVARWSITPYSVAAADRVGRALGLSPTVATILVRRGYDTPEAAQRFLEAEDRHDPLPSVRWTRRAPCCCGTRSRAPRSSCTATTTWTACPPPRSSCARCDGSVRA